MPLQSNAMADVTLQTHDVYNFERLPNPQEVGQQPVTRPEGYDQHFHPQVGLLEYNNISFPHMHIMDLKWHTREAVKMIDDRPSDTVNFNFQMQGNNAIQYAGFRHDNNTAPGAYCMSFHPEGEHYNCVEKDSYLEVLHIALDKSFFAASLGSDSRWTEQIKERLFNNKAYSDAAGSIPMTPQMWHLIHSIVRQKSPGPLRNLMVQSKAMELIALHIAGLNLPQPAKPDISNADVEKLQFLKTHLDTHFLAEHSLSQLSRLCLLNEFKIKRGFKILFGTSVFAYLRKKRMDYATDLLRTGKHTVEEVSDVLGYEYAHHFSAAFKKFTGSNPSAVR